MVHPSAVIVVGLALAAAGCADPYGDATRRSPVPGEQPAAPVKHEAEAASPRRSPRSVAREAAGLAANWTGETAATAYGRLAHLMTGNARRDADEAAARISTDPQLARTRSEGSVQSIGTVTGGAMVVVTRETITADRVRDTRYRVTLARAVRVRGGWLLSQWDPQP